MSVETSASPISTVSDIELVDQPSGPGTVRSGLRLLFEILFAASVLGALTVSYLSITGRIGFERVLTGSMEPTLRAGDTVVTEPIAADKLKVGTIIVFHAPLPGSPAFTHRVYRVIPGVGVETKGDANPSPDPWTIPFQGSTFATPILKVPYVGSFIGTLTRPTVRRLTIAILIGVVAFAFSVMLLPQREAPRHTRRNIPRTRRVMWGATAAIVTGTTFIAAAGVMWLLTANSSRTTTRMANSAILPIGSQGNQVTYNVKTAPAVSEATTLVTLDNEGATPLSHVTLGLRDTAGNTLNSGTFHVTVARCANPWQLTSNSTAPFRCPAGTTTLYDDPQSTGGNAIFDSDLSSLHPGGIDYLQVTVSAKNPPLAAMNLAFTES